MNALLVLGAIVLVTGFLAVLARFLGDRSEKAHGDRLAAIVEEIRERLGKEPR